MAPGRQRVAIVGLGMAVGPHAASYRDLAETIEVAYAFSPSPARRKAFAETFGFPLATSLDQILADDTVDAVTLLTPPNTHLELTLRCAAAGKHVLLEKPLEITLERSERLVAACEQAGVTLGMVLQHRFRPPALRAAELLADGALGTLVSASADILNWRPQTYYDQPGRGDRARDGGGVLLTQAIHTLDLLVALAGLPEEVAAYAATTPVHRMETEDLVAAALRFPGGALGTIHATTAAYPGLAERILLVGTQGTAELDGPRLTVRTHDGGAEDLGPPAGAGDAGGAGADPMAFPRDHHRALIADFFSAIAARGVPKVTGREALKVHRLIAALLASARTGRPTALA